MSKFTKTSDVLISIAKEIQGNGTINSLSKSNFGKMFNVIVGGYAQKLADEDSSPFVWIYSDEEESDINGEGVRSLVVKIVLGVCPLKDVPSTTNVFSDSNRLRGMVSSNDSFYKDVLSIVGEEAEIYEQLSSLVNMVSDLHVVIESDYEDAVSKGKEGSWHDMLEKLSDLSSKSVSVASIHEQISNLVYIEYPQARIAIKNAGTNARNINGLAPQVDDEIYEVIKAFENYEADPYISNVYSQRTDKRAGLVVYGAITMFDNFKEELYEILNEGKFGLPLVSMTFKNQSVSHYPLDWTEFTAKFENQETMNL